MRDRDLASDFYALWPCNAGAFEAWLAVQTQWRVGMAGPTGLDYAGVDALLRMRGIRGDARRELFDALQACEQVALQEWASRRR